MNNALNLLLLGTAITFASTATKHEDTPVAGKGASQPLKTSSLFSEVSVNETELKSEKLAESEKAKKEVEANPLEGYSIDMYTQKGCLPCIAVEEYEIPILKNYGIKTTVYDVVEPANLRYSKRFGVTQYPTICVFKDKKLTHRFTNSKTDVIRAAKIIDTLAGVKMRTKTKTKVQPAKRSDEVKKKLSPRQRLCKCSPCTCRVNVKSQKVFQSSPMGSSFSRSRTKTRTLR